MPKGLDRALLLYVGLCGVTLAEHGDKYIWRDLSPSRHGVSRNPAFPLATIFIDNTERLNLDFSVAIYQIKIVSVFPTS